MNRTPLRNNLLLVTCSVAIFFFILEVTLSLFAPQTVLTHPYHEQYHPLLGWVNKPNVRGKVHITHDIFFNRTHNSKGIRALREYNYKKPEKIKRILLLGDSFFWGFGVNDNDVMSELLQQKLGDKTEVINGSVTGYGTDQELLWLTEEGLRYKPDLVMLGFFPTNDLDEISNSVMYGYPKPYFLLNDGKLLLNNVPVPDTRETRRKAFDLPQSLFGKLKSFLRHNIHSYQFIVRRLNSIKPLRRFFLEVGLADEYTTALPGITSHTLEPDKSQDLSNALILEIKKISNAAGAEFLLAFIPQREKREDPISQNISRDQEAYKWNTKVSTYLETFSTEHDIALIDLLPYVREYEGKDLDIYNTGNFDHHWTPLGHRLVADTIFSWLEKNDWTNASYR